MLNLAGRVRILSFVLILLKLSASYARDSFHNKHKYPGLSASYCMLIRQSGYRLNNSYRVEIAACKQLNEMLKGEAGIRSGLKPVQSDIFTRLTANVVFGKWNPAFGIETVYTNRLCFDVNSNLLKETKGAMAQKPEHFYI